MWTVDFSRKLWRISQISQSYTGPVREYARFGHRHDFDSIKIGIMAENRANLHQEPLFRAINNDSRPCYRFLDFDCI